MTDELPRFPATAAAADDARRYYRNRALQALWLGWRWSGRCIDHGWGVETRFTAPEGVAHRSVFVLEGHVGRGHLSRWLAAEPAVPFVTSTHCPKMKAWFDARGFAHRTIAPPPWPAYAAIAAHYGDGRARRSGRYLMAHIDEGIYLLQRLGAAQVELDAWCLHPLVQGDDELRTTWARGDAPWSGVEPRAVLLAMLYRETANAYLAHHPPGPVPTSSLPEVARLLVADKVQNRKDFERFLRGTLPNRDRLDRYFHEWLTALGVDDKRYLELAGGLLVRLGEASAAVAGEGQRRHLAPARTADG